MSGEDEFQIEASRRRGVLNGTGATFGARAICRALVGDPLEAEADARIAMDLLDPELLGIRANFVSVFGLVSLQRGELGVAEERLFRDPATATIGSGFAGALLLCVRGELRLATGKPGAARDDFRAAAQLAEWIPYANPEVIDPAKRFSRASSR